MGLSYDTTRNLFNAGRYQQILDGCPTDDAALAALTTAHRLLIARTLAHSDAARAAEIAQRENTADAPPDVRAGCELVIGMARRHQGANQRAYAPFPHACQLAP